MPYIFICICVRRNSFIDQFVIIIIKIIRLMKIIMKSTLNVQFRHLLLSDRQRKRGKTR